jgi:hypothetical protein
MLMQLLRSRLVPRDRVDGWLDDERGAASPGRIGHSPLNIDSTLVESPTDRPVPEHETLILGKRSPLEHVIVTQPDC